MRRWRQPRPDDHPRQGPGGRQGARAGGLAVPARHLAGRAFAVVAHGDSQGHEVVREALAEWLSYWEPYATSHDKLDAQPETFVQVENAAKSLVNMVRAIRSGAYRAPDAGLRNPRQK